MPPLAKMLMGAGAAAMAALVAAVVETYRPSGPKGAWKPLWQPEGVPKVTYGRSYVFMTHHKTGTNLMQQLCNYTALLLTGGKDECAFCLRVLQPDKSGYLQCITEGQPPIHGRLRGTFNRFTLVSSISASEFELIRKHAPDFRAIHMVREPTNMTISAYRYSKFINSEEGKRWRWDSWGDVSGEESIDDQLRAEARIMQRYLKEMLGVHEKSKADDRVLELDLEALEANFEDAARRLWLHLLEDVSDAEMQTWLKSAAREDKHRWDDKTKKRHPTVAPGVFVDGAEARRAWRRLEEAGDEAALSVRAFSGQMGYGAAGRP